MGQKVPGPKIHNNIFLLAKGPVPHDQKKIWIIIEIWPKWDIEISYSRNFGPHPGGGYGGWGGISFYEGAKEGSGPR